MHCHRCPHGPDVQAGKYRGVAFGQTPCSKCHMRESSAYTMEFDEKRAAAVPVDGEEPFPEEAPEETLPVSVMTAALAMLMALRAGVRDALCQRYLGALYREIAKSEGLTMAAIEIRHKRALDRWPELRALFPVKVAKQARRKPYRRRKDAGPKARLEQAENRAEDRQAGEKQGGNGWNPAVSSRETGAEGEMVDGCEIAVK